MKSKITIIKISLSLVCAIALFYLDLHAVEPSVCYKIEMKENLSAENLLSSRQETRQEIWCYQKLMNPVGSLYIYNADSNQVKPELSLVLDKDGVLTHGSLLAGKLTVHRVFAKDFNPFSIPLKEPTHLQALPSDFNTSFSLLADNVLNFLLSRTTTSIETFNLLEGTIKINANSMPWRGYWWPYKGQPLSGTSHSPMAKYDHYVKSHSGSSPNSAAWENSHHFSSGLWWEGHCNGWAASSILRSEPKSSKIDSSTGITFSVSDIKGLLSEADSCVNSSFFGHRYHGSGDDIRDVYPALFHKTITYYVGSLRKPVVIDYHNDPVVDNNIVSGYSMTITQTGTFNYSVTAVLRMHKYDNFRTDAPGIAPIYNRTYRYTLRKDASGNIVDGSWLSANPDFIWVPLSPGNCSGRNPGINDHWIRSILDL
jgi:hypothetical protein